MTVEASDSVGLRALAARTTMVATTVGPYARYGKELVRACAEEGTHYADLTGEVLFVRWSLDEVAARAAETGARIVHACGFDSIPSDLGVLVTAERASADDAGTLGQTTLTVRSLRGGISGGTIDSGRQQAIIARDDAVARRTVSDPYGLSPRRSQEPASSRGPGGGVRGTLKRWVPIDRVSETGRWSGPFIMASFNTRIVRLSNTLTDWSYGREFRYREVTDFGASPVSPLMAGGMAIGLGAAVAGLAYRPTRAVLDRVLPKPRKGTDRRAASGRALLDGDPLDHHARRPATSRKWAPTTTPATTAPPSCSASPPSASPSTATCCLTGRECSRRPLPWATCSSTGCGPTVSSSTPGRSPSREVTVMVAVDQRASGVSPKKCLTVWDGQVHTSKHVFGRCPSSA